jgi:hypothetical protein
MIISYYSFMITILVLDIGTLKTGIGFRCGSSGI